MSRGAAWPPGILTAEPAGVAARLAFNRVPRDDIYDELRVQFPDPELSPQRAGQLANQAVAQRSDYRGFERGPNAGQLDRADIPRNPHLPSSYQYIVEVELQGSGGSQTYRTVVVDSAGNMTKRELRDAFAETVEELFDPAAGGSPRGRLDPGEDWTIKGWGLIQAARRT